MKNLLDVINENNNIHTDERGLVVLDSSDFDAMMYDETSGQIQIYPNAKSAIS